jgi:hypothetical protein
MRLNKRLVAIAISAIASISAVAQTIPSVPTFPNEQKDLANAYMNSARALAGGDQDAGFPASLHHGAVVHHVLELCGRQLPNAADQGV